MKPNQKKTTNWKKLGCGEKKGCLQQQLALCQLTLTHEKVSLLLLAAAPCLLRGVLRSAAPFLLRGVLFAAALFLLRGVLLSTSRFLLRGALLAAALGWKLGIPPEKIAQGLSSTKLTTGRMRRIEWEGITLYDDTYNANPESMEAAIETLADTAIPKGAKRIVVLGKMGELGVYAEAAHLKIGKLAADKGLTLIAVGEGADVTAVVAVLVELDGANLRVVLDDGRSPTEEEEGKEHLGKTKAKWIAGPPQTHLDRSSGYRYLALPWKMV